MLEASFGARWLDLPTASVLCHLSSVICDSTIHNPSSIAARDAPFDRSRSLRLVGFYPVETFGPGASGGATEPFV